MEVIEGWEVSGKRSQAALRLADLTPLAKVLVWGPEQGETAVGLGVRYGSARRWDGALVVGSSPGEWMLLAPPGSAASVVDRIPGDGRYVDQTHGRALIRLTGRDGPALLGKVCSIELTDHMAPDGAAIRATVAGVVTDLVRDDVAGARSYLLHCERSSGQYLFDALVDAGAEFGVDVDGFHQQAEWNETAGTTPPARTAPRRVPPGA